MAAEPCGQRFYVLDGSRGRGEGYLPEDWQGVDTPFTGHFEIGLVQSKVWMSQRLHAQLVICLINGTGLRSTLSDHPRQGGAMHESKFLNPVWIFTWSADEVRDLRRRHLSYSVPFARFGRPRMNPGSAVTSTRYR